MGRLGLEGVGGIEDNLDSQSASVESSISPPFQRRAGSPRGSWQGNCDEVKPTGRSAIQQGPDWGEGSACLVLSSLW